MEPSVQPPVQHVALPASGSARLDPLAALGRLLHVAVDGTVESFVNIRDNVAERVGLAAPPPFASQSLQGKVAIVTGGNAGIGLATAQQLARRGAHVVLACRDRARAEEAVQSITRSLPSSPGATPGRVESLPLDLGRLDSVRDFAAAWCRRGLPLHLLVCNAGVMGPPARLTTADGLEMQFQVNFLSHWLLANLLLGQERDRRGQRVTAVPSGPGAAAARSTKAGALELTVGAGRAPTAAAAAAPAAAAAEGTRVVMVTSLTHRAGMLQWADKQSRDSYEPFLSYGFSKLANVMTAVELQRRFDRSPSGYGTDVAVAVHPGLVSTGLANGFFNGRFTGWAAGGPLQGPVEGAVQCFGNLVGPLLMRTPDQSAAVMLHACLAPRDQVSGRYLALGAVAQPDAAAEDPALAAELWTYATTLTGCSPHPSLAA